MAVQRLTAAYRSRPRPSSTPGAKASTVSPYYLDGERPIRRNVRVEKLPLHQYWPCTVFKLHRGARDEDIQPAVSQN
jgi:hypothetical protein